jgi:hypothetical protein
LGKAVPYDAFTYELVGGIPQHLPQLLAGLAAPLLEGLDEVSWRWAR